MTSQDIDELVAPKLSVVYLVPVLISNIYGKRIKFAKMVDKMGKTCESYVQSYVPIEVKDADSLTTDLRVFYRSDMKYYDPAYLQLKRFCRIDLDNLGLQVTLGGKSRHITMKQYITIFDIGIAVYIFWIEDLEDLSKEEIIDMSFINKIQVTLNGRTVQTMASVIQQEIEKVLQPPTGITTQDILEDHLCLLFMRDVPYTLPDGKASLPKAFVDKYKNDIFDIISLPDRYMGVSYDFHESRDPVFIDEVMVNMSVRNDFPVFLFSNRFLGIKIMTGKPDYNFDERIIFNIVLYTNITLQLLLLKEINKSLMNTVIHSSRVTLSEIVRIRHAIYKYLEEYINTSVQRYPIWKKAVKDASAQLGIPDLYGAVEERLDMLNNYLDITLQRHENVWFVILNTVFFFSTVFTYFDYMLQRGIIIDETLTMIVVGIFWFLTVTAYYVRYIR